MLLEISPPKQSVYPRNIARSENASLFCNCSDKGTERQFEDAAFPIISRIRNNPAIFKQRLRGYLACAGLLDNDRGIVRAYAQKFVQSKIFLPITGKSGTCIYEPITP